MDKAFKSLLEGFAKQGAKVTVIEPQKDEDTLESKVDKLIKKMNAGGGSCSLWFFTRTYKRRDQNSIY